MQNVQKLIDEISSVIMERSSSGFDEENPLLSPEHRMVISHCCSKLAQSIESNREFQSIDEQLAAFSNPGIVASYRRHCVGSLLGRVINVEGFEKTLLNYPILRKQMVYAFRDKFCKVIETEAALDSILSSLRDRRELQRFVLGHLTLYLPRIIQSLSGFHQILQTLKGASDLQIILIKAIESKLGSLIQSVERLASILTTLTEPSSELQQWLIGLFEPYLSTQEQLADLLHALSERPALQETLVIALHTRGRFARLSGPGRECVLEALKGDPPLQEMVKQACQQRGIGFKTFIWPISTLFFRSSCFMARSSCIERFCP